MSSKYGTDAYGGKCNRYRDADHSRIEHKRAQEARHVTLGERFGLVPESRAMMGNRQLQLLSRLHFG